jgi:hypothetical protein
VYAVHSGDVEPCGRKAKGRSGPRVRERKR